MYKDRNVIGICTSEIEQKHHVKLLNRVVKEIKESGKYSILFASDSDLYEPTKSNEGDAAVFSLMNFEYLDVIILFAETIKNEKYLQGILDRAFANRIPVISVDKELEGCYNVVYDTDTAFEKMVRHIIEYHGMREVNFIAGMEGNEVSDARINIYKQVLSDNDILVEEDRIGYGDFWYGPTREVMKKFMDPRKTPPEAIICANDSMALEVCDFLYAMDVKVPEEILVTGFDGIEEGDLHFPGITTSSRDAVNDAKKICDMVNWICQGKNVGRHLELPYHMKLSQSCGCQENHLFDTGRLIHNLSETITQCRANAKRNTNIQEKLLLCDKHLDLLEEIGKIIPNNTFICINEDLSLDEDKKIEHKIFDNPFTDKLKAIVNIEGKVSLSDTFLNSLVPEAGKDESHEKPVIVMPFHYMDNVIGYVGMWREKIDNDNMADFIEFLRMLDDSAGYLLSKNKK